MPLMGRLPSPHPTWARKPVTSHPAGPRGDSPPPGDLYLLAAAPSRNGRRQQLTGSPRGLWTQGLGLRDPSAPFGTSGKMGLET